MKVTWTPQKKTDDPKKALEMSIGKFRFFTFCTLSQLKAIPEKHLYECALCIYKRGYTCKPCVFSARHGDTVYSCHSSYNGFGYLFEECREGRATLKTFHAAARKVWEKLKSLRS